MGYIRRNFLVPLPKFETYEALNTDLAKCSRERQKDILNGHKETIGERLERDQEVFLSLPGTAYEACHCQAGRVSSQSLVRYKGNDYSVPVRYGYRDVWVKDYVHEVVISCGAEVIARHQRCYGYGETIFNPLHYLPLLEQKVGALDQATSLANWGLPASFQKLKSVLEKKEGKSGKREYVRVLRLLENFKLEELEKAVQEALHLGAVCYEAIKHLVLCQLDQRPPQLNLIDYPHLPAVSV